MKLNIMMEKYEVDSAIQFTTKRFYGHWSSQRPPPSLKVKYFNHQVEAFLLTKTYPYSQLTLTHHEFRLETQLLTLLGLYCFREEVKNLNILAHILMPNGHKIVTFPCEFRFKFKSGTIWKGKLIHKFLFPMLKNKHFSGYIFLQIWFYYFILPIWGWRVFSSDN